MIHSASAVTEVDWSYPANRLRNIQPPPYWARDGGTQRARTAALKRNNGFPCEWEIARITISVSECFGNSGVGSGPGGPVAREFSRFVDYYPARA